jgi:hypothetical protein
VISNLNSYDSSFRTMSIHRLHSGLQGYLIPFAPQSFVPQRQSLVKQSPSPLVFHDISANSISPYHVPLLPLGFKSYHYSCSHKMIEYHLVFMQYRMRPPTHPLRLVIPDNVRATSVTATAGTRICRLLSFRILSISSPKL